MERTHYYPQPSSLHQDLVSAFSEHLFSNLSWKQWEYMCKHHQQPIYRNEINSVRNIFLANHQSSALTSCTGAYLALNNFFEDILLTYIVCEAFGESPMQDGLYLWFKFSWDNRQLLGKNEAFSITPLNTTLPQSSIHVHNFCIAKCRERGQDLKPIVEEIGLNNFLSFFESKTCAYQGMEYFLRYIISADWMGLVSELCMAYPNTANLEIDVCWGCGANKIHLRGGYFDAPFEYFEPTQNISNFPNALLSSASILHRRYDWMHGVTNMLTNLLKDSFQIFLNNGGSKDTFNAILEDCLDRRIHKGGFKEKSSLTCREMKAFFHRKLHLSLPHIFNQPSLQRKNPYPQPNNIPTLHSFADMLAFALDAIRYYCDLMYKPIPTPDEIQHLHITRTTILSFYAGNRWRLPPTTHFMTNEALYFIELDKTAHITLQEGVEHHNFDDMVQSTHTLQSAEHFLSHESNWQMLLNNQQLKLEAHKYNLTPINHSLLPGALQNLYANNTPLLLTKM